MNNLLCALSMTVIACFATASLADTSQKTRSKIELTDAQKESVRRFKEKIAGKTHAEIIYMRTGGLLVKPGSGTGKVVVFNAQDKWPKDKVQSFFDELAMLFRIKIDVEESDPIELGKFTETMTSKNAIAAIQLIDNGVGMPKSLVSYEDAWGIVNVGSFSSTSPMLYDGRMKRLIFRTFALTCGIGDPQSIGSAMWPAKDELAFDALYLPDRALPNIIIPIERHLQKLGLTTTEVKTYKTACEQGWAPPPTNDIQKTIWDKVHATPKTPMKIEFDPKKGR